MRYILTPLLVLINLLCFAQPTANFIAPDVCLGNSTCFADASTSDTCYITDYEWTFGEPSAGGTDHSTVQNPCHVYSAAGTYTVSLIVTNCAGDKDTNYQYVSVFYPPVAYFTSADSVCLNDMICFTDSSYDYGMIVSWLWNFNDGGPDTTIQNPCHFFPSSATYNVMLTATNMYGCSSQYTKPVTVDICGGTDKENMFDLYKIAFDTHANIATITTNGTLNDVDINVYTSIGQLYQQTEHISGEQIKIDCHSFPTGIYYINITQGSRSLTTLKLPVAK